MNSPEMEVWRATKFHAGSQTSGVRKLSINRGSPGGCATVCQFMNPFGATIAQPSNLLLLCSAIEPASCSGNPRRPVDNRRNAIRSGLQQSAYVTTYAQGALLAFLRTRLLDLPAVLTASPLLRLLPHTRYISATPLITIRTATQVKSRNSTFSRARCRATQEDTVPATASMLQKTRSNFTVAMPQARCHQC